MWVTDNVAVIWGGIVGAVGAIGVVITNATASGIGFISGIEPVIWAATAAAFSAVSSFLTYRVQRRNLLNTARPELVLSGWNRDTHDGDKLRFSTIRNTGPGSALHVSFTLESRMDEFTSVVYAETIHILPSGDKHHIGGAINLWWDNVKPKGPDKQMHQYIDLVILCWDTQGQRHATHHRMMVEGPEQSRRNLGTVMPGVHIMQRLPVTRSVRSLKARRWLGRVSGLGRFMDK